MGGVSSEFGGSIGITYFTDDLQAPSRTRLAVVAIWRGPPADPSRRVPADTEWRPPDGWASARDEDGEREMLYHDGRGVVRVAGQEYPLPTDGAALLLLVDEGLQKRHAPVVTVRTLAAPKHLRHTIDRSLDKATRLPLIVAEFREQHEAWTALVRGDPAVQAFLAKDTDDENRSP